MRLEEEHARLAAVIGPAPRGILAVDFDDTLTADGGVAAVIELRRRGYGIVIFSANADTEGIVAWITARWPDNAGPLPPVTDRKPQARWFIDDKAFVFTSWDEALKRL